MGMDSYLEIFTTVFGWTIANIIGGLAIDTGLIFVPLIVTIVSVFAEAHENGHELGGVEWSIRKMEVELYGALFVFSMAFVPTPWTTMDRAGLYYQPTATVANPSPGAVTGANSGTTYDQAFGSSPGSVPVPIWWYTVMSLSSGFTNGIRTAVSTGYLGLRQAEELAKLATIEDPALRSEAQLFRDQCFVPAHAKFHDPGTPRSSTINSILTDPLYGRDDTEWIGSLSFREDPDYYRSFRARQPIRDFALDMTGDDSDAPPGTTGFSMPNCLRWWTDPNAGLRDRLINQGGTYMKRAADTVWGIVNAADSGLKVGPVGSGVFNADYVKDEILRQALWRSHANFVQTDQVLGGENKSRWMLPEVTSMGGVAYKSFESSLSYYPVSQFMLLAQPLILMVLYAFMPLVVLFSRFSLAFLMHGAIAIFTVKFWAAMWAIARVMDERIVAALYGDTTVLVREFMTNGLDGGSKRAILNVLTVALFIVIPMMWSGMMAWVGFKVGAVVHDAVKSAHEAGTDVGESTAKVIKDAVSDAIKSRFKK